MKKYWIALLALVAPLHSQQPADWKDPSSHVRRFVTVSDNVRLEVLDWGGSGRPLVLLAGGGDTAHVFDEFAAKLTADFHVYGITRRGFGESGFAPPASGGDTYGDDVLAVLDALKLARPVLVGHSIEADLASSVALGQYFLRIQGFAFPEAELRQQRPVSADGRVGRPRDFPGYSTLLAGTKKYFDIRVPALVIFALPHGLGRWVDSSTDPKVREQANAYTAALTPLTARQAQLIEDGVRTARVVKLPGAHHYIYLSNEADVIREMRSFLDRLQ